MNEDALYAQAMADADAGNVEPGMWAKAFALADGEPNKTKAKYIRLWVQSKLTSIPEKSDVKYAPRPQHKGERKPVREHAHTCPKCHSNNWKLCSVIFAAGAGRPDGKNPGVPKSGFAQMAAKPAKPYQSVKQLESDLHKAKKDLQKYLASPHATVEPIFFLGMQVPGHPGTRIKREIERLKGLLAQHEYHNDWPITRMCLRCGNRYVPGKQSPEDRVEAIFIRGSNESIEDDDAKEEAYRKRIGLS